MQDDEYIPHGEDIEAFLKREIAKPIIRWEDSPQLGYEILPNKYFYRYQPPTPAKDLLAEFWRLEKEAEKMLEGLAKHEATSMQRTLASAIAIDGRSDRGQRSRCCQSIRQRAERRIPTMTTSSIPVIRTRTIDADVACESLDV